MEVTLFNQFKAHRANMQYKPPAQNQIIIEHQPATNKNNKINHGKTFALWVGASALAIAAFAGAKKVFSKPSKKELEVMLLFSYKGDEVNKIIETTKVKGNKLIEITKNKLNELFQTHKVVIENPIKLAEAKISKAKDKSELLTVEDELINSVQAWFKNTLLTKKEKADSLYKEYQKILAPYKKDLKAQVESAKDDINKVIKSTANVETNIKTKKHKSNFDYVASSAVNEIEEFNQKGLDIIQTEARIKALFNKSTRTEILKKKHQYNDEIIDNISKKLATNNDSLIANRAINSNLNIIPASMNKSLIENDFYQFASKIDINDNKKLTQEALNYAETMGVNNSLKDINTFIKRLELRQKASVENISEHNWYEKTIKATKKVEAKLKEILEGQFYTSGKNIDIDNITPEQAQSLVQKLELHSQKLGYSSSDEMAFSLLQADPHKYTESPMYNIYAKLSKNGHFDSHWDLRINKPESYKL